MITKLEILSNEELSNLRKQFLSQKPFNYVVIDNFLDEDTALKIANEFPSIDDDIWYSYDNPLEIKKATNNWNHFGPNIYQFFTKVLSENFTDKLSFLVNDNLIPDIGLHGGGLHTHGNGGKLNPHLDYSIHPKVGWQRRLNIILYINPEWKPEYGGSLGIWSNNSKTNRPDKLEAEVDCIFNRALIFDTTQNSWHGISKIINNDKNLTRNSLATYYLSKPKYDFDDRKKVLFAPTKDQEGDEEIEELIKQRQSIQTFKSAYIRK